MLRVHPFEKVELQAYESCHSTEKTAHRSLDTFYQQKDNFSFTRK